MPLPILIALVVGGIAGIALLTHAMGLSTPRKITNEKDARIAWLREFPDIPVQAVTLCNAGAAALVLTPQGPGVVWAMGLDTTARLLTHASALVEAQGLSVTLPDYSAPRIRLHLGPDQARDWAQTIGRNPS